MEKKKKWPEDWQDINPGLMVFRPGSARDYLTGSWRADRPVFEESKCIRCGVCYMFCPEGCVFQAENGYFSANLDYCKGCGICAQECWPRAITMIAEEV